MLDITVLISIFFGLCIITSNNPMFSILYLIGLFISVAGYLYYINLGIMSLLYLLIYVGAIAILFLFILSLLDVKVSELKAQSIKQDIPLILMVSLILFYGFYKFYNLNINFLDLGYLMDYKYNGDFQELFSNLSISGLPYVFNNVSNLSNNLSIVLVDNWYDIYSINELTSVGDILYTEYGILFILMGITLLLSIIGAIVVTTFKK